MVGWRSAVTLFFCFFIVLFHSYCTCKGLLFPGLAARFLSQGLVRGDGNIIMLSNFWERRDKVILRNCSSIDVVECRHVAMEG